MSSSIESSRDKLADLDRLSANRDLESSTEGQNTEIAIAIKNLQELQSANHKILLALSEDSAIRSEKIERLTRENQDLEVRIKRIQENKKKELENSACKVGNLIGGIVICALIATGVVIIVLKQTHTI